MKSNSILKYLFVVFFIVMLFHSDAFAVDDSKPESLITVPWEEFKDFLPLDKNEIVLPMETFQKLVVQTGVKTLPRHTLKQGKVVLSPEEFKKLVDRMKPPKDKEVKPPFDFLITKADYSGKMGKNNTSFKVTFDIHVLVPKKYFKIPLLPHTIALEDVRVNGKSALVVRENGYHHVVITKPGRYKAVAFFSVRSSIERGPHKVDVPIQQTPITILKLELPMDKIDVEIPQARQVATHSVDKSTIISAVLAPGPEISIRWRKKADSVEKIPPKLYSELFHLVSIDDDALKINTEIRYNILHKEIDHIRLSVPSGLNVLSISGEGVGEWQEIETEKKREILVPFTYSKKGHVSITVISESPLTEEGNTNAFTGIRTLDTVRETGFIGIDLNTSAEVKVAESTGMEKVAAQKLPMRLYNKSIKPLIYAFRYFKHPYGLVLDIHKHDKLSVPVAAINSASIVTLFTQDGKVVHRLVYQVRNSAKQFLEIKLPKKADIWSVFVDNKPVESSINRKGKLLVPLIRSRSVNNRLSTFTVEVIYCLVGKQFTTSGLKETQLPGVDLLISQLIWSIYLPNDYSYHYFDSTLEKEDIIRGINVFQGAQRQYNDNIMKEVNRKLEQKGQAVQKEQFKQIYKGKNYQSKFRSLPVKEEQIVNQLNEELQFSGRLNSLAQQLDGYRSSGGTGILPIQIEIPTGGQVYRFAKTIITSDDPLTIRITYTQNLITKSAMWLCVFLGLLLIYILRKKIFNLINKIKIRVDALLVNMKKYDHLIRKIGQSIFTTIILMGLFVVGCFVSKYIALPAFFLFWISLAYQLIVYFKNRSEKKQPPALPSKEESMI